MTKEVTKIDLDDDKSETNTDPRYGATRDFVGGHQVYYDRREVRFVWSQTVTPRKPRKTVEETIREAA